MKRTLVVGASEKQERYSNKAIRMLTERDIPVVAHGNRAGNVEGIPILTDFSTITDIHTVTLYLSAKNQEAFYEPIIALAPKRVIFNPGTANPVFENLLVEQGIAVEHACTLVLLSTGMY